MENNNPEKEDKKCNCIGGPLIESNMTVAYCRRCGFKVSPHQEPVATQSKELSKCCGAKIACCNRCNTVVCEKPICSKCKLPFVAQKNKEDFSTEETHFAINCPPQEPKEDIVIGYESGKEKIIPFPQEPMEWAKELKTALDIFQVAPDALSKKQIILLVGAQIKQAEERGYQKGLHETAIKLDKEMIDWLKNNDESGDLLDEIKKDAYDKGQEDRKDRSIKELKLEIERVFNNAEAREDRVELEDILSIITNQ